MVCSSVNATTLSVFQPWPLAVSAGYGLAQSGNRSCACPIGTLAVQCANTALLGEFSPRFPLGRILWTEFVRFTDPTRRNQHLILWPAAECIQGRVTAVYCFSNSSKATCTFT